MSPKTTSVPLSTREVRTHRHVGAEVGYGQDQLAACGRGRVPSDDLACARVPPLHLPGPVRHWDTGANRLEFRRRLAVVLGAPGALLVVEPEQQLAVARQSQGVDARVPAGAVAGQEKRANLEPVPLDVGEADVMPARGHFDGDLLVVVAHPDVPLVEMVGRLPWSLTRPPRGQRPVEPDLVVHGDT